MNTQNSSRMIFDRALTRARRNRIHEHLPDSNFLFNWTQKGLIDRLSVVKKTFPTVLQLGARHNATLSTDLKKAAGANTLMTSDMAETLLPAHQESGLVFCADEERLPLAAKSCDMISSCLALHCVNDLPGALIQIRRSLKPDGLFLAALPGGETLYELRRALMQAESNIRSGISPRIAPYADKQQMGALMQRAGYALPVVDSEFVKVSYKNLKALLRDLKHMGESNALYDRSKSLTPLTLFDTAEKVYRAQFSDNDGTLTATFEIIFLIGWAPHESQQKPLRPGSARSRLADALNTEEVSTGAPTGPDTKS